LPMNAPIHSSSRIARLAALFLVLIAIGRIVSTYHVFNQAYDEPAHIACGMEWLDKGTFKMEPQHPPLPRVAVALGPYLAGLRLPEVGFVDGDQANGYDFYGAGNQILYARGQYFHNLTLARMGVLPFFLITALVTFLWARSLLGDWPAVLAVLLLTTLPTVLGYSSVAYVDAGLLAFLPAALLALVRWLDSPGWERSLLLGGAVAGAALSNTPAMVFLPPCVLAIVLCRWWALRGETAVPLRQAVRLCVRLWWRPVALTLVAACVVLWGGYRFAVRPLSEIVERPAHDIAALKLPGPLQRLALKVVVADPSLPAPEFFKGILGAAAENRKLYPAYLFGQVRRGGWWYFYFCVLAFKTPPLLLIFSLIGIWLALARFRKERDWRIAAPAISVVAILLVAMPIKVNLGIRHILFVYPLLAILAAFAGYEIWQRRARGPRLVPVALGVLLFLHVLSTAWIHPNYLTYTSIFAGRHPEDRLLFGGDVDGGQDIVRLPQALAEHNVQNLHLRLYTSADLAQMNLPPFQSLAPYQRTTGWIAISILPLRAGDGLWNGLHQDGYRWLDAYQPVACVGKTIRLFYVPVDSQIETNPADSPPVLH
jgi:Dolichyl-phosphate-mannose-protein mannosyltransferase